MRVLWVTNVPLPEASILLGELPSPFGGWLINSSMLISKLDNLDLTISFPSNKLKKINGSSIKYYTFNNNINDIEKDFNHILNEVNPDLVHIYGTELPHTLTVIKICKKQNKKVIISIQGLVSTIAEHYLSGIPYKIQKNYTFRDFIKRDNIIQQKNKFYQKGLLEIEAIKNVEHIIGRTSFDRLCINNINPNANYYHCNEILRSCFYDYKWSSTKIEKYSIFVSQGTYTIKGLHYMIKALPIILKKYPSTKMYVSGGNIFKFATLKNKLKITTYAKYINKLINYYNVENSIEFIGLLNEKEMCKRYLKSNVFVCPSIIENSPNSLGEAMLLGVPCVASYVGGIPDLINHNDEGYLYQHDAPYMLASYICEIFQNDNIAKKISNNARERAIRTHDQVINTNKLHEIYTSIYQK